MTGRLHRVLETRPHLQEGRSDEVAAIDALETGIRGGPEPDRITLESDGRTTGGLR